MKNRARATKQAKMQNISALWFIGSIQNSASSWFREKTSMNVQKMMTVAIPMRMFAPQPDSLS